MSLLSASIQALDLNAPPAQAAVASPISALLAKIQTIPRTTRANEIITDFLASASHTKQNRPIMRAIQPIKNGEQKLSFFCTNKDATMAKDPLALAVSQRPADAFRETLALGELYLPQKLRRQLVVNTAQEWLERVIGKSERLEPIQAQVSTCCMTAPVSTKENTSQVVGGFESGPEPEVWVFLCYNRGGDCHSEQIVHFNPNSFFQLQNGPLRQGSDWSIFTMEKDHVDAIRQENPTLATEIEKSNLVVIGVKLTAVAKPAPLPIRSTLCAEYEELRPAMGCTNLCQKAKVATEQCDTLVSESRRQNEENLHVSEEVACLVIEEVVGRRAHLPAAQQADYGVIGKGQNRAIDWEQTNFDGAYEVLPGYAFVCMAGSVPVDFHDHEDFLSAYLDSVEKRRDDMAAEMERLDRTRQTVAELKELLIKDAQIEFVSSQPDLFVRKNIYFLDYSKAVQVDQDGNVKLANGKHIAFTNYQESYTKMPVLICYASSEKKELLVYSFKGEGYTVQAFNLESAEKVGESSFVHLDDMAHQRMYS